MVYLHCGNFSLFSIFISSRTQKAQKRKTSNVHPIRSFYARFVSWFWLLTWFFFLYLRNLFVKKIKSLKLHRDEMLHRDVGRILYKSMMEHFCKKFKSLYLLAIFSKNFRQMFDRVLNTPVTVKNTVISPNFVVWKFCEKAQFPPSLGRYGKTMRNFAFP